MEELLAPLGFNVKLVFIQLVGFLLLYWLLKKFLFGRVSDMINKRSEEIKNAYDGNERTREELNALKAEYEQKLLDAQKEAESIIQQAVEKAEKAGQELLENARQEASAFKEKGLAEIQQEKHRVISEIRTDVVNLAVAVASRIIEKSIDTADAERLSDDVMEKMQGMDL